MSQLSSSSSSSEEEAVVARLATAALVVAGLALVIVTVDEAVAGQLTTRVVRAPPVWMGLDGG